MARKACTAGNSTIDRVRRVSRFNASNWLMSSFSLRQTPETSSGHVLRIMPDDVIEFLVRYLDKPATTRLLNGTYQQLKQTSYLVLYSQVDCGEVAAEKSRRRNR